MLNMVGFEMLTKSGQLYPLQVQEDIWIFMQLKIADILSWDKKQ
jgi:hypothetical protein